MTRIIKSAVVTGPSGTIGAALCSLLCKKGIRVYAISRPRCKNLGNIPQHKLLQLIECDAAELPSLCEKINHADAFFHLAWKGTGRDSRDDLKIQTENISCTLEAVETAKSLGCSVFIGAGSHAEYGVRNVPLAPDTPCFPVTGYGAAKHCAGVMCLRRGKQIGLDCIWMRILSVYGKYQESGSMLTDMIGKMLDGEKLSVTEGDQIWDYLYCDDSAEAMLAAAQKGIGGAVYVIGSGQARPLREYIRIIRDAVDPTLPIGFGEIPYTPGQIMRLEADITSFTHDTGFVPQISFEEGIRRTVAWRRERRLAEHRDR
ncbi:MAG: NAD(P)-dependent oxidoreductase [Ruminococcus sp.]|nr:NAD(P)-dependent oxidoreductase [Ruminococcus sp.]